MDRQTSSTLATEQYKSSSSSEKLHQFDLHGCLVFDDFTPISCPPRKGLLASLSILTSPEQIQDIISSELPPSSITFPTWPSTTESSNTTTSSTNTSTTTTTQPILERSSCIFVIPVIVPPQVLLDTPTTSNHSRVGAVSNTSPPSAEIERDAELLIENRKAWMRQFSSAFDNHQGQQQQDIKRSDQVVDDSVSDVPNDTIEGEHAELDARNESEAELSHFEEFLTSLTDPSEHSCKEAATKKWLDDIMTFLRLMETAGCLGVVLIGLLPNSHSRMDGPKNDESVSTAVDIASYLPKKFRTELLMPAVFSQQQYQQFDSVMSLYQRSAINRAAITPIPLKAGDHIQREIREKGALKYMKHHGIYTGNGRIIHFSGNEVSLGKLLFKQKKAKICSTSIIKFMKQGSRLKVRKYSRSDEPEIVVRRAEDALSEQTFDEYSLFSNNCEHFCSWCKTGKGRSKQVERGIAYATAAGVATAAVVVALAMKKH